MCVMVVVGRFHSDGECPMIMMMVCVCVCVMVVRSVS